MLDRSISRVRFTTVLLASLATACGDPGSVGDEAEPLGQAQTELRQHHPRPSPPPARLSELRRETERLLNRPVAAMAKLNLVFVLDGLRPDSINAEDTPNLYYLRENGVNFVNGHAVFPTVTRVNAPSISTGYYPAQAGIIGNSIYIPEINPASEISTGGWQNLLALDDVSGGHLLFVPSLGERLQAHGKLLAAVSSGSSGSAFLLNHRAPEGVGVLVNGYLEGVEPRVAYPDAVNDVVLARFGSAPPKGDSTDAELLEPANWAEDVLREYILPEVRPDVVLNWITQPDGSQHSFGAGSPEALKTIRNDDRNIGLILAKLEELGLAEATNIIVVSDHGFSLYTEQVDLEGELIAAGLKESDTSDDVVLASSGQAVAIHVKRHSRRKIEKIVEFLQAQPWAGPLFTRASKHSDDDHVQGWVPGTFSLELIHHDNEERGADIYVTFNWTSNENEFGVEGTDARTGSATGPLEGNASGHGSMNPWTVRNTWLAWGTDFKDGVVNRVPSSNVDIVPTLLTLQGIDASDTDGRVLGEALNGGPDYEKVPLETRTYATRAGDFGALIQVTEVGRQRYIDKSWRTE